MKTLAENFHGSTISFYRRYIFMLSLFIIISIFLLIINSTSDALYINQLKRREVSVETCFKNLKVLSFSSNS